MIKTTFLILIVIGIFSSFLLSLKEKTKEKAKIPNIKIMEAEIDFLIIPDRKKAAAIR